MAQVSLEKLIISARSGELVSFPTDTVPALAARPDRAEAIFQVKQRRQDKPLILMVSEPAELWQYTQGSEAELAIWQAIANRYLPGALTLVLPASDLIPAAMNPRQDQTIGLRVPAHDIARSILAQTGALATTSANLSGRSPLLTMAEIQADFPQVSSLKIEVDLPRSGQPSTVVQWSNASWQILRQGAVTFTP